MDSVEFSVKPAKLDFYFHGFTSLLRSSLFWIYLVVIGAILLVLSLLKIYPLLLLIVFIGLGLVLPITCVLYFPGRGYKKEDTTFIVSEEECGIKTNSLEYYVRWKGFNRIRETRSYIFLYGQVPFTIYKYLLPAETVASIKTIIAEAPVKNKKLLPDK